MEKVITLEEFRAMSEDEKMENVQYLSKEDLFKVRMEVKPSSVQVIERVELSDEEKQKAKESLKRMIDYFNTKR